jgi:parallel beta-helix repeat protein
MPVRRARPGMLKKPRQLSKKTRRRLSLASKAMGLGAAALAASPAANAAVFNVSNLNDSGPGSLRQAIADSNTLAGADVITFQPGLTGTITLTTGQLEIYESLDIQGPGSSVLTVSGNNASRVFYMYDELADHDIRIAGLTVTEGLGQIGGGIVDFDENLELDDVTITASNAIEGGGLWVNNFNTGVTIRNSTISGNIASDDGGGIYFYQTGTPLLIENSVISGNQAANDGGGISFYVAGETTIVDTEISGNSANFGGGVFLYATSGTGASFTIERSTISGNDAIAGGGMFFYRPYDLVTIENSTISGNHATDGNGGGIYFYGGYSGLVLNFDTIAFNTAEGGSPAHRGGGVFLVAGDADVTNSIVAHNTAPQPDEYDLSGGQGATFDLRYSMTNDSNVHINKIVGNIGGDAQLAPLADNGGPTPTHRPALTSPVINAADPAFVPPPLTDQRGEPRVYRGRADMGAVELAGGVIEFKPTTYTVAENGGSVTLTIVRDVGPDPASVLVTLNAGTATGGGVDYSGGGGTVTFAAGELSKPFVVPIVDDALVEGNEQFTAVLSNESADATIGAGNPATVTITDFEEGQFVLSSPTYSVGEQGGFITITVNRVNGSNGAVAVSYSTAPGTATPGGGNDYTTTAGTLNWADGDSAPKTFNVPILDDTAAEGNEDFSVALSAPTGGATVGSPASATVTIVDDPVGTAQFSVSSIDTTEEAGSVTVTVTRTGGTEGALAVSYATANGSAVTPGDYLPAAGTITFPAGSAAPQTFNITLVDDNVNEGAEMFTANLTGANVGAPNSVTINLAASDAAPGIPTLSWFGRILLTMMSALAGLYVMVRNRFSMFLVGLLLIGVIASPSLLAAQPAQKSANAQATKRDKGGKFSGTLQSATNVGGNLVLTLTGGISITIPQGAPTTFSDNRTAKPKPAQLSDLKAGTQVIVKLRTDAQGNITSVKIKIKG